MADSGILFPLILGVTMQQMKKTIKIIASVTAVGSHLIVGGSRRCVHLSIGWACQCSSVNNCVETNITSNMRGSNHKLAAW